MMSLKKLRTYTSVADRTSHKLALAWMVFLNINIVQRVLRKLRPLPNFIRHLSVMPRVLNGKRVELDPTDSSHFVIFTEILVDNIYDFSCVPFVPELILDCGGHIGLFTLMSQNRFPGTRAVAFEPNSENLPYLRTQNESNQLGVEIEPVAVSDFNGYATFSAGCSCSGAITRDVNPSAETASTQVVDLCQILAGHKVERLILKMDIEGGEDILIPKIVPLLPRQTAFYFETHFGEANWLKHVKTLEQAGFNVTRTSNRGPYSDGLAIRS
jgi:FkbM family methyltransferase